MSEGIWVYVFLIFCGVWFGIILIGIGALIGYERGNKRELGDDTDTRLYVPSRCRVRRSDNRRNKGDER